MDLLTLLFIAAIGLAACLASVAVWSPRATAVRTLAVVLALALMPLGYVALDGLRSQPKPMAHEWFKSHVDQAIVLGMSVDEGRAIFLWLRLDDSLEPRYYVLPWRRQLAERLESLLDEAMQAHGLVTIRDPFARDGFKDLGDINVEVVLPPQPPMKLPPVAPDIIDPREREV